MIVGLIGLIVLSLALTWIAHRLPFMVIANTSPLNLLSLRLMSGLGMLSWSKKSADMRAS